MRSPTASDWRAYTVLNQLPPTWWELWGGVIMGGVISGLCLAGAILFPFWASWGLFAVVTILNATSLERWQ